MPHRKFFRLWRPTKLLLPAICLSAALCYAQQAAIIDGHTHIAVTKYVNGTQQTIWTHDPNMCGKCSLEKLKEINRSIINQGNALKRR